MTFEGRGAPPQTMQQCIDAATDKAMQDDRRQGMRADKLLEARTKKRSGDTIMINSVCNIGDAARRPRTASSPATSIPPTP